MVYVLNSLQTLMSFYKVTQKTTCLQGNDQDLGGDADTSSTYRKVCVWSLWLELLVVQCPYVNWGIKTERPTQDVVGVVSCIK